MLDTIDEARVEAFLGRVVTEVGAAPNTALVAVGDELGLWRAMGDAQPVTAAELASRTGTHERYVRERLNAQAASEFVLYDYGFSTLVCIPGSLSQPGRAGLGTQAGEARLREVLHAGGFEHVRLAARTPFNLVLEAT